MNQLKFAIAALAGVQATTYVASSQPTSPTPEQAEQYADWAHEMQRYVEEYSWEPFEVTTGDGYVLTTFKISKRFPDCENPQSVVVQHSYGNDSVEFIKFSNDRFEEKAAIFQIVDDCFDVWMGNFRGTRYSLQHTNPDPLYNTTADYWNYSLSQFGLFDLPAVMDKVFMDNGGEKMYLINASLSTTVTFYALAQPDEDEYFINRLHRVVQMAPCSNVREREDLSGDMPIPVEALFGVFQAGVYHIGGPNWTETGHARLCALVSAELCELSRNLGQSQAQAIVLQSHFAQNSQVGKFQEYIEPENWFAGQRDSEPVDLSQIKIPMTFLVHVGDTSCFVSTAEEMAEAITSDVDIAYFRNERTDVDEHNFAAAGNNNIRFIHRLKTALRPDADQGTCQF